MSCVGCQTSWLRQLAVVCIGEFSQQDDKECIKLLLERCDDSAAHVREHAAQALGAVACRGNRVCVEKLCALMQGDKDRKARLNSIAALGKLAKPMYKFALDALLSLKEALLEDDEM